MSINFPTLQSLIIPEGKVKQITDASGRVIWRKNKETPETDAVILEVKKITSNTYAGETLYENEQFILLDIYPKTNGTVNVTYGGLTKTITDTSGAEEPNAQEVFFGTFNGVTDSVATPASGELTIEGDYYAFGCATYKKSKSIFTQCGCVTAVTNWGDITHIPVGAFGACTALTDITIPNTITSIVSAFDGCTSLVSVYIPDSVIEIFSAFTRCINLTNIEIDNNNEYFSSNGVTLFNKNKTELLEYPSVSGNYIIPDSVTSIGINAFADCISLTSITIPDSVAIIRRSAFRDCVGLTNIIFSNSLTTIESDAFIRCKGLQAITIPSGVTSIGEFAFSYCESLINVTVLATTPPTIDYSTFQHNTATITVPKGCGDIYKSTTNWRIYADYIVEAS